MKLDRTKYFIRGNGKYPELIRQFFSGYENWKSYTFNNSYNYYCIYNNSVEYVNRDSYMLLNKTELKLTNLAIKNDLGEEYAPKMKEFFEKLECDISTLGFMSELAYSVINNCCVVIWGVHIKKYKKVQILLSDWLGMEEPKEKTESLTAFEAEVLEKTKRRTFKIESFKNKITKEQQHIFIPYQLCPKCNGSGQIAAEFYGTTTNPTIQCDVCNGQKIIPMYLKQ